MACSTWRKWLAPGWVSSHAHARFWRAAQRSTIAALPPGVGFFQLLPRDHFRKRTHLFGQQREEVVDRNDSHQGLLPGDNWDAANTRRTHLPDRLEDALILFDALQFRRHDIPDRDHRGVQLGGHDGNHDVTVGDDPDRNPRAIRALDHQEIAYMIGAHDLSRIFDRGIGG